MKRILLLALLCIGFGSYCAAQQNPADAPATKEDIQRYFDVVHSKEMITKMVDAMSKPMHQMIQEQFDKDKDKLPPDFVARMTKSMDDQMKSMPWDEMLGAMVPVYQKHLTKGDVDALVAFYSTGAGQKLLKEMPAIAGEALQSVMPLMRKHLDSMNQHLQEQIAAMEKESEQKAAKPGT